MHDIMPNKMVKAGEVVFEEGDAPDEGIFYICYGDVEISRQEMGQERSLAKLTTGGVFGEMGIINSAPRNATVTALTDCGFLTINQKNLQHKVDQLDPVLRGVFRVFVLTIRDFIEQRDQWMGHLNALTSQIGQMTGEASSSVAAKVEGEASDSGKLADGVVRKLHH